MSTWQVIYVEIVYGICTKRSAAALMRTSTEQHKVQIEFYIIQRCYDLQKNAEHVDIS